MDSQTFCNYNFIKLKPHKIDENYHDLYRMISYNIQIILIIISNNNTGVIPIDIKKTIIYIIETIIFMVKSFNEQNNNYSLYTDNNIFYNCMPYYIDFNKISKIVNSNGIDFLLLNNINISTNDNEIENIIIDIYTSISYYIGK